MDTTFCFFSDKEWNFIATGQLQWSHNFFIHLNFLFSDIIERTLEFRNAAIINWEGKMLFFCCRCFVCFFFLGSKGNSHIFIKTHL